MTRRIITLLICCTVAAAALPTQPAAAQEEASPFTVRDISFPGGTLADYVAMLVHTFPHSNIMISEDAGEVRVPKIDLKDVTLQAAVQLLENLELTDKESPRARFAVTTVGSPGSRATYMISVRTSGSSRPTQDYFRTRVWTLPNTSSESAPRADAMLAAIETAVEIASAEGDAPPTLRYHEPTRLIFFKGSHDQLNAVDQVIAALHSQPNDSAVKEQQFRQELHAQGAIISDLDRKRQEAELSAHAATLQMEQLRVRLEATERLLAEREKQIEELRTVVQQLSGYRRSAEEADQRQRELNNRDTPASDHPRRNQP